MTDHRKAVALMMKDAVTLAGVDYRTIKLGIETGTISTVQLDPRRMILGRVSCATSGVDVCQGRSTVPAAHVNDCGCLSRMGFRTSGPRRSSP